MTAQDLKNAILQLAMQGKLTKQDTHEQSYVGRFFEVPEEARPFEIPECWSMVYLDNLVAKPIKRGKSPSYAPKSSVLVFAQKCNIKYGGIDLSLAQYLDESKLSKYPEDEFMRDRDIVINCTGTGTLGRIGFYRSTDNPLNIPIVPDSHVTIVRAIADVNPKYIYHCLEFYSKQLERKGEGSTNQKELKADIIKKLPIPLPTLAEQSRIVAKIEELLPYIEEYDAAEKQLTALNKRFPDQLRKSILQQAIMGQLTERDPADEPASELLKRIRAEKAQLVKEGKLKKEKPLSPITEDDMPFEIPEGWEWAKIGDIAVVQSSKRVFEKDYVSEGVPFFRSKEIGDLQRGEAIKTELFISEQHYQVIRENYGVPKEGDILITSVGTIGNTWICDGREFYYKDGNITQICGSQFFDSRYIELVIHSPLFLERALSTVAGTAYTALTIIKLKNIVVPLPPLAEQQRIVERVEELLAVCEQLGR